MLFLDTTAGAKAHRRVASPRFFVDATLDEIRVINDLTKELGLVADCGVHLVER